MTILRSSRMFLAGATVLTVAVVSLVAHADRNAHVPGTACTPRKADVGRINYSNTSAVNDDTATSARVYCPIFYESQGTLDSNGEHNKPSNLFIRVIDRNRNADISCKLSVHINESVGSPIWQRTANSAGFLNPDDPTNPIQDINHASDEGINVNDAPGLVYAMSCSLPPATSDGKSEIVNYQLGPVRIPPN